MCLADSKNTKLENGAFSLADLAELAHVRGTFGDYAVTHVDELLAEANIRPKQSIAVRGFLPIPIMLQGTEMIGFVPERIARDYAPTLGLVIAKTPLTASPLVEVAYWHPSKSTDPALSWLIDTLRMAAKSLRTMDKL